MYRIKDNGGRYYNQDNDCMGPVQAATLYSNHCDLPIYILDATLALDICHNGYYPIGSYEMEPTCWIEEVR